MAFLDETGLTTVINRLKECGEVYRAERAGHAYTADVADYVGKKMTVKLNNGNTEGTNKFSYDGSQAKEVNITPSAIGAVAAVEGSRLITSAEANKLDALVLGDGGKVEISGKVNAANVEGLSGLLDAKVNQTSFDAHLGATNPHGVTAAQVGAYTKDEINTKVSSLQSSIDGKQASITGGASTITSSNLTANRALISNGSGKVAVSDITSTKLGYLTDVTSNIQAQLDNKAGTGTATTSAAGLMSAADKTKLNGLNNYSLPVAGSSLGGVKSGTDITVDSSGNVSVNDNSHAHTIANITNLQSTLDNKANISDIPTVPTKVSAFTNDVGYLTSVPSHGNHVPATQTANNAVFLRNDNSWQTVTPGNIGAYTKSEVDTKLGNKQDSITLTANRALVSDGNGKVAVSAVTSTELGYLDGVTSNIQTQINNKAATTDVVPNTRTVNGKALSSNISLTASDVGAATSSDISSAVSSHASSTTHITAAERTAWNNKSNFSGNYNDLTNKPNIAEDGSGELTIQDSNGNAIFKADADGIKTPTIVANSVIVDGDELAKHQHYKIQNSHGAVVSLLNTGDGSSTYMLTPKDTSSTDYYRVYLGTANAPYQGLYTNFVVSNGVIQADSGNILANGANSIIQGENQIYAKKKLTCDGTLDVGGVTTVTARIVPSKTNNVNLGLADARWLGIYSGSAVNVSSDLTVKTDLTEIDDRYIELFDLVQPYAYKFIDGTSGRYHTGFISQYVEEAMEQVGLKDTDLAFFCKDAMFEHIKDEDGNIIEEKPILNEDGTQKYFYSLRYEEYIAIMVEKMKRMEKRINELETKLEKMDELEARLANLEKA